MIILTDQPWLVPLLYDFINPVIINLKFQLSILLDSFTDSTVKALKLPQGDYSELQRTKHGIQSP